MAIVPGSRLGPYEILSPLGAGGMGEVYRARDTRLERLVAIKVLPDHLASQPELKQRFEREARAVSNLNHPHICTLHDIGHQDGLDYMVMELIEGESLADRLRRGPLTTDQVIRYAMQIVDALDKAHRAGIVHRDLKPGNIMLTKSGAKLLDFGLAKRLPTDSGTVLNGFSELLTEVEKLTGEGSIVGTLQYMAPEQLEGLDSDSRTDIFAFGAVLYEMATGKRAFIGRTQVSLIGAILHSEPTAISSLQPLSPSALDRVVATCLAKDQENRWQSARDLWLELKWIAEKEARSQSAAVGGRRSISQSLVGPILGFLLGLVVASVGYWILLGRSHPKSVTEPKPARLTIRLPDSEPIALTAFSPLAVGRVAIAISPDGSNLVYVGNHNGTAQLVLRPLGVFEAKLISGTDGAYNPFFSPDGNWVGFFADNKLKKVSLRGGEAVTLCEARNPVGATWGQGDRIFFGDHEGGVLSQISAKGGTLEVVPVRDPVNGLHLLPDGRWLLYSTNQSSNPDYAQIKALSLESGQNKIVCDGASNPVYLPGGQLVFTRAASLMAATFDLANQKVSGPAVTLIEGIRGEAYGNAQVSVSLNGTVVYIPGLASWIGKPVWVDKQGNVTPTVMPTQCYSGFQLSRDGKRLAIGVANAKDDIWINDLERGTFLRLTVDGHHSGPVWSPDGRRVAYSSTGGAQSGIFCKAADGSGSEENLTTSENNLVPESWSPDGKLLAFSEWKASDAGDIWILNLEGKTAQPFLRTRFSEVFAAFSPNGRWMAYISDESGRYEVYVRPYPGPGGQWQISTQGGEEPVWSADGREIFYRNGEKWMVAVVHTESEFDAAPPQLLFEAYFINVPGFSHALAADGKRQMMIKASDQDPSPKQLNVVMNLLEELKQAP